jgi:hypothetical protein
MKSRVACALLVCLLGADRVFAQVPASQPGASMLPDFLPEAGGQPQPAASRPTADQQPCLTCRSWDQATDGCCGAGSNWWLGADYLLWWFKDAHTPPLVTTGPPGSAGIIGRGATVLFGGPDIDLGDHQGARFTAGLMFDDDRLLGFEGNYFFLAQRGASFFAGNSGDPVLARPFFNANLAAQDSELVSSTGSVTGSVRVALESRLQGAEANLLYALDEECDFHLTLLSGFRYVQLDEGLTVSENLLLPGFVAGPTSGLPDQPSSAIGLSDFFGTHNHFYGGQVGLRGEWWHEFAFVRLEGKAALGLNHESITIDGSTRFATPPAAVPITRPGGLLAVPTNMGHFHRDEFAVLPEVGVKLGYQFTSWACLTVGYSFLYWSAVARPGDQVDFALNPSQLPTSTGPGSLVGPARPSANLHGTDFWAHGVNVGLEVRY